MAQIADVWIQARAKSPAEQHAAAQDRALLRAQLSFLANCFRLQIVERRLWERVGQKRPRGSNHAVRLIELERQRLGRDLHTGVGQMLAAIRLQLEVLAAQVPAMPAAARATLDRITTLASDALEQVRGVSRRLHPPEWQRLRIEAALQQLWDLSGIPQKYESQLEIEPLPTEPDLDIKVLFYRTTQEALSNLVRHSQATRIEMSLRAVEGAIILAIQDNGVGFDVERLISAPASVAAGLGLRAIREQAESAGGRFVVESGPNGTKLEVSVPLVPRRT